MSKQEERPPLIARDNPALQMFDPRPGEEFWGGWNVVDHKAYWALTKGKTPRALMNPRFRQFSYDATIMWIVVSSERLFIGHDPSKSWGECSLDRVRNIRCHRGMLPNVQASFELQREDGSWEEVILLTAKRRARGLVSLLREKVASYNAQKPDKRATGE